MKLNRKDFFKTLLFGGVAVATAPAHAAQVTLTGDPRVGNPHLMGNCHPIGEGDIVPRNFPIPQNPILVDIDLDKRRECMRTASEWYANYLAAHPMYIPYGRSL